MKSGINPNKSTRIYTNLHESTQSRFKALQALFLADIAHYNYKSSCGLSKGLKMLASMILSPLSKVVLEAWGKCVLGYTLLPNCCAENGLHPCIIFQVGKPNSPQSSICGCSMVIASNIELIISNRYKRIKTTRQKDISK